MEDADISKLTYQVKAYPSTKSDPILIFIK